MNPSEHLLETVRFEFQRNKQLAEKAMAQLNDDEFQKQSTPDSNSVQIIVQHLAGNIISRWTDFLTTDGEKKWRNRDSEFESQHLSREELMQHWEKAWNILFDTINNLAAENLLQTIHIRKEPMTVTQAMLRQISHYSYHVGQIVQLAKEWKGEEWKTLSIPKNKSAEHGLGSYKEGK
ncbi:MAG: DUF1572 domain-containing protein [Bacteroidota bacterium]|nr:DUF1572 domain-containing protein [Bacteroidota bacterium]